MPIREASRIGRGCRQFKCIAAKKIVCPIPGCFSEKVPSSAQYLDAKLPTKTKKWFFVQLVIARFKICTHLELMQPNDDSGTDGQIARESLLEIMARVANSDKAALEELYQLTSAKLFGVCRRICGDSSAAEDVLQDVYIKVWHRADQYQAGNYSPISWLAVIARNASIDWLRKNGRQNYDDEAVIEIIADDAPLGDAMIEDKQQKAKIMDCLEQLDKEQNQPIRSAFFGGYTYSELAKQIDVPLSTMKSRIRRGLMTLKKCLEDG